MIKVELPDGNVLSLENGSTAYDVAQAIGPGLAKSALAAKLNDKIVDLSTPINQDVKIEILTPKTPQSLEILRHSCAHIMAQAIKSLWPQAKLVYGPTVKDGFYYDIDLDYSIKPEDFPKIEQKMSEIANAALPFKRIELTKQQALERVQGDIYKTDNIERADGDVIAFYTHGHGFEDLCRGPHIPDTSKVGAFKVMSVAGAYWHGDASEKMLQRVYGTAWPNKKMLDEYLERLEEAKKRDHRIIGKQMNLFSFHDEGPGFAFLHPKGMTLWNQIIDYWRDIHRRYEYSEIKTPIMLNESLWHKSGHWDNYKENMYFTTVDEVTYAVKPMNCPGGLLVYNSSQHSYREFPMRVAELGLVHRYEASGQMHGLIRVRQFTQDDGHIFCRPDQIQDEIKVVIDMIFQIYKTFGFEDFHIELSTKPEKHIGSDEIWETATNSLVGALNDKKIDYQLNEGDGAFYGPKIDFHIEDCLKRSWQLGTIQLDFSMPARFELTYTDSDNSEKTPVMIHRAILGSLERFMGILIEHYAGAFPLWLAPEQVRILTISEKVEDYACDILKKLKSAPIRCSIDLAADKIGAKIARAHLDHPPYMLVIGEKEKQAGQVNIRTRGSKSTVNMNIDDFIKNLTKIIDERRLSLDIE